MDTRGLRIRRVDASDELVGRLAAQLAKVLQGKDKPTYRPDRDYGDVVVVENVSDIQLTHNKWTSKQYFWHTGYRLKSERARDVHARKPTAVLERAVSGMLPKNRLRQWRMRKLLLYPHAQGDFAEHELTDWRMPYRRLKREQYVPELPEGVVPLNPQAYNRALKYAREKGTTVQLDYADLFSDQEDQRSK